MPIVRYAGLGALGAAAGLLGLYVLIVLSTLPHRGGLDMTNAMVTWISVGGVIAALIAVHLVYARILIRSAAVSDDTRSGAP